MKAVVVENYDSIDNIRLQDVPMPDMTVGQVRVKIAAASVGFVDGLKVQGLYQTRDPLPFTPGTEFSGVVDAAAADVTGLTPGTPVMGMTRSGALAEYITVPAAALEAMPAGIAPEVAASFRANYLTSLYALSERAAIRAGEYLHWAPPAASGSRRFNSASSWAPASSPRHRPRRNEILRRASAPTRRWIIRRPIGAIS